MRVWLRRNHALAWTYLISVALILAILVKWGVISGDLIKKKKDLIDATGTILTTTLVLIAALASYFRFFHGRLLNPKLCINSTHGLVEVEGGILHWLDVELENKGSAALWDYKVTITAITDKINSEVQLHSLASTKKKSLHVIDPGETAYEHGTVRVSKETEFLTFKIEVRDSTGTTWDKCLTVSSLV